MSKTRLIVALNLGFWEVKQLKNVKPYRQLHARNVKRTFQLNDFALLFSESCKLLNYLTLTIQRTLVVASIFLCGISEIKNFAFLPCITALHWKEA